VEIIVSPKISALAFDDIKEQTLDEFVPELNVIVNRRNIVKNNASFLSAEADFILAAAVEVKGMFTVSF
jgi:hypothetical protein